MILKENKLYIILVIFIILFEIFNYKISKREYVKPLEQLVLANPTTLKVSTNLYSTFYADKFWLLSTFIDEFQKDRNTEWNLNKMEKGYTAINYLDKNFTQPIVYAVSYIIINEKDYKRGMRILNEALRKSPTNPKLLFQKLIYMTTYAPEKPDIKEVMKIAKELYKQEVIFQGIFKISDFVAELIEYNTKTKEGKIKNLKLLLKTTKNKEIKEDVEEILKKYNKKEISKGKTNE